jgi:hypothetical protein
MRFYEVVIRIIALLQREERVSYRALKRGKSLGFVIPANAGVQVLGAEYV